MKRFLAFFLLLALATSISCRKGEEEGAASQPETPPVVTPTVPEETQDIEIVFIKDLESPSFSWPFATPAASTVSSSLTDHKGSFRGVKTDFVMPADKGGHRFSIYASDGIARHTTQGFRFKGDAGDYMELPAIEGKRLKTVTLITTNVPKCVVCGPNGETIPGGNIISTGSNSTWELYGGAANTRLRLALAAAGSVHMAQLRLRYTNLTAEIDDRPVVVKDYLSKAKTPEERFNALRDAHSMAVATGKDPDYTGVGVVSLEIPANAESIPLSLHTDFKNAVFKVKNTSKKLNLFDLSNVRQSIQVTGAQIDAADYSAVPELASGLHLLILQDNTYWVQEREGYGYGHTRKDAVLVRDGVGSNGPCASYQTEATVINASYCVATDEEKSFCNLRFERDIESTFMTFLARFDSQNNLRLSNITVVTPENGWTDDRCITISNSTNVLGEDITFEGTYSETDHSGYGFSLNALYNCTFRRLHSACQWGVFGSNNLQHSLLEDSDTERFDTHCYGRDITVRNSTLTGRGMPVSSIFGTILYEHSTINNTYFFSIRSDYNSYVDCDIILKDCTLNPASTNSIFQLGRLDNKINERPELARKRWPNVQIEGLTVNMRSGAKEFFLFRPTTATNTYEEPLGHISKIDIKGLRFNYPQGASSAKFTFSRTAAQVENDLEVKLDGLEITAPGSAQPNEISVNVRGKTTSISLTNSDAVLEGKTIDL
ncbi:MAG: hypothetical protein IJV01_06180 [Bacteroidales bacterium]|nr:hypothetical protein [Bacteroidales bacterium]